MERFESSYGQMSCELLPDHSSLKDQIMPKFEVCLFDWVERALLKLKKCVKIAKYFQTYQDCQS